jgi:hypothetical protein
MTSVALVFLLFACVIWKGSGIEKDLISDFFTALKANTEVKYCEDKTRLLPDCKACIPGLKEAAGGSKRAEHAHVALASSSTTSHEHTTSLLD